MIISSNNNQAKAPSTASLFAAVLLATVLLSLAGCGPDGPYKLAPVSGTVLIDGQPTANVVVIFTPIANNDTSIVGPFSSAVTDADGSFALKSKQGSEGAVVGRHSVSCQYRSYNPEAVDNLRARVQEARQSGGDVAAVTADLEKAKNQKMIPAKYSNIPVTVGENGLKDHKFELTAE